VSPDLSPQGDERWTGPVADSDVDHRVVDRSEVFAGRKWAVRTDRVDIDGHVVARDYVVHTGAVGIIAIDGADRVLLIRQYRHPVGRARSEPPAGLLDEAGEPPLATARRELLEEAGVEADDWHVLVDVLTTPGGSSETLRIYLARGLRPAVGGRVHTGEAEEMSLPQAWVPLDEARDLVLGGAVQNPTSVAGILAAWASRADGWTSLRPADAPWPARDRVVARGGVPSA